MTEEELLQIIEQAAEEKVTSLNLSGKELTKLPPEIGQLSNLTALSLNDNQLRNLPPEIGQLSHLTRLNLNNNQLRNLPPEIGQLSTLTELGLSSNQLRNLPPEIGQLSHLTVLNLEDTQLSALPPEIVNLTNLTRLSLGGNQLSALPPEIGQLSNLIQLNLNNNQLSELPPEIVNLTNLIQLEIWGNQLSELPPGIVNLTNLTRLSLGGNQLSALPPEIGQLSNLTTLNLRLNQLRNLPPEIGQLSTLTELYLDNNQLSALPLEIGNLTNLTRLDLYKNQLSALLPEIGQLSYLTVLFLHENQLRALPPEIGQLSTLTTLGLWSNQLRALPPEIGQLSTLTMLLLHENQLSALPLEIGNLTNLTRLDLYKNQLSALLPEIGQLFNLTKLQLSVNQLRALPPEIGQLSNLTRLDLRFNQLRALPPEIANLTNLKAINLEEIPEKWPDDVLYLGGNPLLYPPPEILNQGIDATLAYLREALHTQQPQWVSKLIVVGEGGVGKTSLLKVLRGEPFNPQQSTTHGIDIRTLEFPHPSKPEVTMQLNAWDFGGQQIYHATHQFFLTNRSLFLLAWNARYGYEQGKLYYWLDTLSSLAPDSPILLIATQIDDRHPSIPLAELQGKYPQIVGHCEISSKTGEGIDNLRDWLTKTAAQLPLMGELWPKTWLDAANDIRSLSDKYITPQELATRMTAAGVSPDSIPILAQYLHELGEILYFQDNPALNEIVILKPEWVTEHISRVLSSETVKQRQGILTRTEMNHLWQDLDPFMRQNFLRLLEQFDLSYIIRNEAESVPEDASLIVECLPLDPPNYQPRWDGIRTTGNCQEMSIKWQLNTIPAGIPTWIIARSHRFSTGIHWRNGALLADSNPAKHLALVQAFPQQNYLQLTVRGATPQNFFTLLRDGIELTLSRFKGLQVKRTIPCSVVGCQQGSQEFDEQNLQKCYEKNRPTLECPECLENRSVVKLLFGLDINPQSVPASPANSDKQTAVLLSRLNQLEQNIIAGQTEKATENRELIQREFTTFFRIEQGKIESHCPSVFALRPCDTANWKKKLFGQKFELQLYCEAPGEWHPALDGGLYEIEVSAEWFKIMAPHIQRLACILKYVTPIIGSKLGIGNVENYEKLLKRDMQFMEILAAELPKLQGADALDLLQNTGIGSSNQFKPEQLQGAGLRVLRQLLDEKDPHQHWGGLQKVLTPEGHYLWLCERHASQYQG